MCQIICNVRYGVLFLFAMFGVALTANLRKYSIDDSVETSEHKTCGEKEELTLYGDDYECRCKKGFALLKGTCIECRATCGANEECYFAENFPACRCSRGFDLWNGECRSCVCEKNELCRINPEFKYKIFRECHCLEGYERVNGTCIVPDPCRSNPCKNDGRCASYGKGYKCICDKLHSGKYCEIECNAFPACDENEECYVTENATACRCAEGYERWNGICTDRNPCNSNPCKNGGKCNVVNDTDYTCNCDKMHRGENCEIKCADLCGKNEECYLTENTTACRCAKGYARWYGECRACLEDCGENEQCTANPEFKYKMFPLCVCIEGYERVGKVCQETHYCDSNPCLNGGTCRENGTSFLCDCTEQYSGKVCEKSRNRGRKPRFEVQRLQLINIERISFGEDAPNNDSDGFDELWNLATLLQRKRNN